MIGDQPTHDCPRCGWTMPLFGRCPKCSLANVLDQQLKRPRPVRLSTKPRQETR